MSQAAPFKWKCKKEYTTENTESTETEKGFSAISVFSAVTNFTPKLLSNSASRISKGCAKQ
jgi:hypothetical protein